MPTNDFQTFGAAAGSNVLTQAAYLALQARVTGFQTGIANSSQVNKVWRQSSIISSMIGQFIADFSGSNATDDGTIATLEANFILALQQNTRLRVPAIGVNLFVAPTGSDTNVGSGTAPFLTIQKAINVANSAYDSQGNPITINLAAGTYTASGTAIGPLMGNGVLNIKGASAASTLINLAAPGSCIFASAGARLAVTNLAMGSPTGSASLGGTTGNCLAANLGALIQFNNVTFNATQYAHMTANVGGLIQATGPYTIAGGASYHAVGGDGEVQMQLQTVTLTGTPSFSAAFAWADGGGGLVYAPSTVWSGAAAGQKFLCTNGGYISTVGTTLPGSIAGVNVNGYFN